RRAVMIGQRVAAARKLREMTGRDLADRAHISYSLLTKVETGHVPATQDFIAACARALQVDPRELTGDPYRAQTPAPDPADAPVLRRGGRGGRGHPHVPPGRRPPRPGPPQAIPGEPAASTGHRGRATERCPVRPTRRGVTWSAPGTAGHRRNHPGRPRRRTA